MCSKLYLILSGLVFALVALGHLWRLVCHVQILVGDWPLPIWTSWAALVVAGILCLWAIWLLFRK